MVSVEKEGMKLYDQLEKITGAESQRLSTLMEDFVHCKKAWEHGQRSKTLI